MTLPIKVSVIMPIYNAEAYLRDTMDTVVTQTLRDIEILCVNDGSTDSSVSILQEYAANDDRIKIITQENAGAGAARNTGLDAAQGEYVIFLDSDDLFEPTLLEDTYSRAQSMDADICLCDADKLDMTTGKLRREKMLTGPFPDHDPFNIRSCPRFIYRVTSNESWNKLIKRKLMVDNAIHYQTCRCITDTSAITLAMSVAERITVLKKVLVHYKMNRSGSILDHYDKHPEAMLSSFIEAYKELDQRGILDDPAIRYAFTERATHNCLSVLYKVKDFETFKEIYEKTLAEEKVLGYRDWEPDAYSIYDTKFRIPLIQKDLSAADYVYEEYRRHYQIRNDLWQKEGQLLAENKKRDQQIKSLKAQLEEEKIKNRQAKEQIREKDALIRSKEELLQKEKSSAAALEQKYKASQYHLNHIRASVSFRLGRALTAIPRKIRDLFTRR